jgi:hypothetical protein
VPEGWPPPAGAVTAESRLTLPPASGSGRRPARAAVVRLVCAALSLERLSRDVGLHRGAAAASGCARAWDVSRDARDDNKRAGGSGPRQRAEADQGTHGDGGCSRPRAQ